MNTLSCEDVLSASHRIRNFIKRTPVFTNQEMNRQSGTEIFFKCENFQLTGAFKIRGAGNAVLSLSDQELMHGVATHSSGNHGAALACAAKWRGKPCFVVMPGNSNPVKKKAVTGYDARTVFCEPNVKAREIELDKIVQKTGALFIPSYNHPLIIAGQGTAALELIECIPDLDAIIAPVGGGGLLSGTALAAKGLLTRVELYGGEPANAADARESLHKGRIVPVSSPDTIADGLRTSLGSLTFAIIKEHVKDILLVTEERILQTMLLVWQQMKMIIEPSSAVAVAAVLDNAEVFRGKRTGIIISGGNVHLKHPPCHF